MVDADGIPAGQQGPGRRAGHRGRLRRRGRRTPARCSGTGRWASSRWPRSRPAPRSVAAGGRGQPRVHRRRRRRLGRRGAAARPRREARSTTSPPAAARRWSTWRAAPCRGRRPGGDRRSRRPIRAGGLSGRGKPAGRRPLVAGNWKMNLTHLEAIALVQKIAFSLTETELEAVEVVVLPPFTAIRSVQTLIDGDKLLLGYGAQDLSPHASGAYTGDVGGPMLAKLGCSYVVVGHSERRQHHREDDARGGGEGQRGVRARAGARSSASASGRTSGRPAGTSRTACDQLDAALGRAAGRAGPPDRDRVRAGLGDRHRQGRHAGRRAGDVRGAPHPAGRALLRRPRRRGADPLRRLGEGGRTPPRSWPGRTSTARWSAAPAWTATSSRGSAARPTRRRGPARPGGERPAAPAHAGAPGAALAALVRGRRARSAGCRSGGDDRPVDPSAVRGLDTGSTGVRQPSSPAGRHAPAGQRHGRQPRPGPVVLAGRVERDAPLHPAAGRLRAEAGRRGHPGGAGPGHRARPHHGRRPDLDLHAAPRGALGGRLAAHLGGREVRHRAAVRLRRHHRRADLGGAAAGRPGGPVRRAVPGQADRPARAAQHQHAGPADGRLQAGQAVRGLGRRAGAAGGQPGAAAGRHRGHVRPEAAVAGPYRVARSRRTAPSRSTATATGPRPSTRSAPRCRTGSCSSRTCWRPSGTARCWPARRTPT